MSSHTKKVPDLKNPDCIQFSPIHVKDRNVKYTSSYERMQADRTPCRPLCHCVPDMTVMTDVQNIDCEVSGSSREQEHLTDCLLESGDDSQLSGLMFP